MVRRSLAVVLTAVALVSSGVAAAPRFQRAPTLDEIIARHLQAKGGLEKLKAVQTIKQTGKVTIQGMTGSLTIYGKRPNLQRQELQLAGQVMVNAFDGATAWSINPMTGSSAPSILAAPQAAAIKDQSDFDSPLVDYQARGYKVEFIGTETVDARSVYHLRLTSKTQQVQQCYIDSQTNLETKVVGETPVGLLEQEMSDFRDVQGLKFPFAIRTLSGGLPVTQLTIDTIELNPTIDDAVFKVPGKIY